MDFLGAKDDAGFVSYPEEVTRKYVIGKMLGKGAFGKVYAGTERHNPSQQVAIK